MVKLFDEKIENRESCENALTGKIYSLTSDREKGIPLFPFCINLGRFLGLSIRLSDSDRILLDFSPSMQPCIIQSVLYPFDLQSVYPSLDRPNHSFQTICPKLDHLTYCGSPQLSIHLSNPCLMLPDFNHSVRFKPWIIRSRFL